MRKEGLKFVLPTLVLAGVSLWCSGGEGAENWWIYLALISMAFCLFFANFFRDPFRQIPADPGLMVSPADGRVVAIQDIRDPFVGKATEVRVFLNIFDVHLQRSPFTVSSKVKKLRYHPGVFLNAADEKASLKNEQNWIEMEGPGRTKVVVKQIAGLLARRILCWVKENSEIRPGHRLGMIQFGSQVDLVFPARHECLVKVGQKVLGGETPMVRLAGSVRKK